MVPTEDDLNRAMGAALGYEIVASASKEYDYSTGYSFRPDEWRTPDGEYYDECGPDFCTNRNLLPEIKQAIEAADAYFDFSREMQDACIDLPEWRKSRTFTVTFAEPKRVVTAALKALGKWPEEWEEEA